MELRLKSLWLCDSGAERQFQLWGTLNIIRPGKLSSDEVKRSIHPIMKTVIPKPFTVKRLYFSVPRPTMLTRHVVQG